MVLVAFTALPGIYPGFLSCGPPFINKFVVCMKVGWIMMEGSYVCTWVVIRSGSVQPDWGFYMGGPKPNPEPVPNTAIRFTPLHIKEDIGNQISDA